MYEKTLTQNSKFLVDFLLVRILELCYNLPLYYYLPLGIKRWPFGVSMKMVVSVAPVASMNLTSNRSKWLEP